MLARAEAVLADLGEEAFAGVVRQVIADGRSRRVADARARRSTQALGLPVSDRREPRSATDFDSTVTYALRFYYDAFEAFDADPLPARVRHRHRRDEPGRDPPHQPARVRAAGRREAARPRVLRGTRSTISGRSSISSGASTTCSGAASTRSESLIRALVPQEHPDFEALVDEAHRHHRRGVRRRPGSRRCRASRSWDWFLNEYAAAGRSRRRAPTLDDPRPRRVVAGQVVRSGALPTKVAPGWTVLGVGHAAEPGRLAGGAARAAVLLFLGTWPASSRSRPGSCCSWPGIALVATDANLALGIVLLVLAALFAGAVVGGLWVAIAKLRAAVEKRVGSFIFGPYGSARPAARAAARLADGVREPRQHRACASRACASG